VREVLAGEEGERQLLARVGRRRRAEAAHLARAVLGLEPVEVLLVRLEARDARLDAAALAGARADQLARHDLVEALVARDLEPDAPLALELGDARPERHAARRRIARGDALRELARLQERRRPGAREAGHERLRREHRRARGARPREELPS
jgi:hypothetical protein